MKSILCVAMGLLFIAVACKKDEETSACVQLQGKWAATSWKEDDEEFFGDTNFITSSILEFKVLDGNLGDVDWTVDDTLGGPIDIIGSYMVNESCNEVTITPKSGASTTYAFTIRGDKLTLDTYNLNLHIVQEYERQ